MKKPAAKSKAKTTKNPKAAKTSLEPIETVSPPPTKKFPKLPSAWQISRRAGKVLRENWKLFLGITLIQVVLNLLLVRGFTGISDLATLKLVLDSGFGQLGGGLGAFLVLFSSSGQNPSPAGGLYQFLLVIIFSLAFVWALRQVMAGIPKVRIRDAFYQGMYPFVPVLLVLLVICLELIPLIIGATLYATFVTGGIASTAIEIILWSILSLLFAAVSVYLLVSSVFAFYVAALPDMTPVKSIRSAGELVRYRRWSVLRKLLFLPFVLFVIAMIIMVPIIIFLTPAAPWVFFVLLMIALPLVHAYMYSLYRELLV